ncbi:hypothetical protein [Novosphingobium terrae]|uniref:hypothetical protein n=1 Tax=Novosphingobium terrae TaxID=2726189 RepID=UPI0019801EA4|nr:hypothetical protein [Novosphingobium terrae]
MDSNTWLRGVNVDATLIEIRDDEHRVWEERALAGASIGTDPVAGLQAVIELDFAVSAMLRGDHNGKGALARILGAPGQDYQRALWYNLAGRHPLTLASAVAALRQLMTARAEMWLSAQRLGLEPTKEPEPYFTDRQEGPRGTFSAAFSLGSHWRDIAQGALTRKTEEGRL